MLLPLLLLPLVVLFLLLLPEVVLDMSNPWVFFRLSLPISMKTHTQVVWVWVFIVFCVGTDMGKEPKGKGTDLKNINYTVVTTTQ